MAREAASERPEARPPIEAVEEAIEEENVDVGDPSAGYSDA
jgi:hypothetical protein